MINEDTLNNNIKKHAEEIKDRFIDYAHEAYDKLTESEREQLVVHPILKEASHNYLAKLLLMVYEREAVEDSIHSETLLENVPKVRKLLKSR
jgi:hypothetical protein